MSELTERLRDEPNLDETIRGLSVQSMCVWHNTACQAADTIDAQQAEIRRLECTIELEVALRAEIERQSEMIQAMEAVMSEIGETLGVTPGDVPILMIRIGNGIRAQAEVTRQQAAIERLQKSYLGSAKMNGKLRVRIERLQGALNEIVSLGTGEFTKCRLGRGRKTGVQECGHIARKTLSEKGDE